MEQRREMRIDRHLVAAVAAVQRHRVEEVHRAARADEGREQRAESPMQAPQSSTTSPGRGPSGVPLRVGTYCR